MLQSEKFKVQYLRFKLDNFVLDGTCELLPTPSCGLSWYYKKGHGGL